MADIVRWNPFREMAAMQRALDDFWRTDWPSRTGWSGFDTPALDIHENDQEYTVTTSLPGINPNDINVRIHNGILTIGPTDPIRHRPGDRHEERDPLGDALVPPAHARHAHAQRDRIVDRVAIHLRQSLSIVFHLQEHGALRRIDPDTR